MTGLVGELKGARERSWRGVAAWALAFVCAHILGSLLTDPVRHVAVFWPASGVTFAALLLAPRKRWPLVAVALSSLGFVMNVARGAALPLSIGFFVANVLDALIGVWLVAKISKRDVTFTRVDEVFAVGAAATLVNGATAVIGAASSSAFTHAPFWAAYRTWWTGDMLGIVLVTPLIVVWMRDSPDRALRPRRPLECAAFLVTWTAAAWIATEIAVEGPLAPRPYMMLCLLPWPALRFGLRTVAVANLILCVAVGRAALYGTILDFEGGHLTDALMRAQLYVAFAAITGLTLGASASEARLARAEADRSAAHLNLALDAARMGTWEWDVKAGRIHWSAQIFRLFGVTPDAFGGSFDEYIALIHPDDRAGVAAAIERALLPDSPEYTVEHRVIRPDGSIRWVEARGRVDRAADGTPLRMAGMTFDATQQRQVAERLRQTQKMEAFGQLAGGVAHDFNNLLSVILMQAEIGRQHVSPSDPSRLVLDEIASAAERGAALTKQLLAFARQQVVQPKAVELNDAVRGVTTMLRRVLPEEVRMRVDLCASPLYAEVDVGMLDQVIVNLALNARDAMPGGGELSIASSLVEVASGDREGVPAGTYAAIRVSDTGTGIAPEHLPRLFEPFFTTKEPGKGTGLGLATVFGILRIHHGHMRVASELGKGSTFELLLPPAEPPLEEGPSVSSVPVPGRRRGTILLVEDEERVRKTTRTLLEMHHYDVIEARSGDDALRIWDEHQNEVDLLFTDLTMPGTVDGLQLAAELRRRRPGLRVVLTSGYSMQISGDLEPGTRFLMKPSSLPDLLDAVNGALRG